MNIILVISFSVGGDSKPTDSAHGDEGAGFRLAALFIAMVSLTAYLGVILSGFGGIAGGSASELERRARQAAVRFFVQAYTAVVSAVVLVFGPIVATSGGLLPDGFQS